MGKMRIKSQTGELTIFANVISIGQRHPNQLIGDKVRTLLKEKNMTEEDLIKNIGNSYRDNITRVLKDEEIPKKTLIERLIRTFEVSDDYFEDKELNNVIITDNNIVVGKYATSARALEVKKELDSLIEECWAKGLPISINMPNE